jgi:hypothetical protein
MREIVDNLSSFFRESDFWTTQHEFLMRADVIHHEVNIETNIDPVALEYLFLEFLQLIGRRVESIGHAIVGDCGYIKIYTIERPILNVVWRHNPDCVIAPQENWYTTWTDADVTRYLSRTQPRRASAEDLQEIEDFFASRVWRDVIAKLTDDETEHFHAFLLTELHPDDLDHAFRAALENLGFSIRVPTFYLPQPEEHPLAEPGREAIWLGYAPPGVKSFEISCIFASDVTLGTKEYTAKERLYGGDGWTTSQYNDFIMNNPRGQILTPGEARLVARAMRL